MTFLVALTLGILLAHRLGAFQPWQEYRAQLAFDTEVYRIAEEAEWEERMQRYSERLGYLRRLPFVFAR